MGHTPPRFAAAAAFLALAAACGGGGGSTITVTVSPASAFVGVGQTQPFTATVVGAADQTVTWSVEEGSVGGAISTGGLYTAPLLPGSFHVVATSIADGSRSGTATVSVVPPPACTLETPQPSALPSARVLQLGVHTVGETVTFTVPATTGSVTILQQGTEPLAAQSVTYQGSLLANTVVPLTLKVGGVEFFNDNVTPTADPAFWGTKNGIGSIFFASASPWAGTLTVPNTTHMLEYMVDHGGGVPAGTWSVVVNDYAEECKVIGSAKCVVGDGTLTYPPGKYDVKVLLKPGAVPAAGTVDVDFYLVTDRLDASSASTSGSVARMRDTLAGYFAPAGLALGNVTFVDMPADVKARYHNGVNVDDLLACGDVSTVLRMSNPGNTMNLVLVNSLVSNQGGAFTYVGIDGTIPGPSSVGGTVASGALVSVADLETGAATACGGAVNLRGCGADRTAYIAAHETGHFLGLYHVTESDGKNFDPVQDTPTCELTACAPGKTEVAAVDCLKAQPGPCGGGDNLMFWLLSGALSTGNLSTQQSSILRANPLVR
jgi:hypothetical protein